MGSPRLGINQSHSLATPWEWGSSQHTPSASQMISPPFPTPFSQGIWGSSAQDSLSYPTQLNIWLGRAGPLYASSCCFGSRHILIAHTPGALDSSSAMSTARGGCQLNGIEHAWCYLTPCFPGARKANHLGSKTAEASALERMLGANFYPIPSQKQELRQFDVPNSIPGVSHEQWGVIRGV